MTASANETAEALQPGTRCLLGARVQQRAGRVFEEQSQLRDRNRQTSRHRFMLLR